MNRTLLLSALLFLLNACATQPSAKDAAVDAKLGLVQDEHTEEAEKSLDEIKDAERLEQKRELERYITDPLSR